MAEITIFSKRGTSKDGNVFYRYITKLVKKTGETITAAVKFRESCGSPEGDKCPMNIIVDKSDLNYAEKDIEYIDKKTGEAKQATNRDLWVKDWKPGSAYKDTSMDDFDL